MRFRQVWGQEWKHCAVFAWAAVPPDGFVALGMAVTSTHEPPAVTSIRCVPKVWTQVSLVTPKLVWSNSGGGGGAASAWLTNSLGVAHVVLGHEPPAQEACVDLVPVASMLPEDLLAPVAAPPRIEPRTGGLGQSGFVKATATGFGSVNASTSGSYGAASGDSAAPPLRGRAAMFESVAEERRGEQLFKEKRERDMREREERRLAQLRENGERGGDIFGGFFGDTPVEPTLVSVAPTAPAGRGFPPLVPNTDVNPFAAGNSFSNNSRPRPSPVVPPPAGAIPGMDLLTGSPVATSNANDPLGALDPLGAGQSGLRVKKETVSMFGAAAANRNKKAE